MNIFIATGNLGQDCEIKSLPSGTTICSFSVAVKSGYGDKQKTNWLRCSIFGKRAEGGLPAFLIKGAQVCVSGELSLNEYTKKDGSQGASLELNAQNITLVGSKSDAQINQPQPRPQPRPPVVNDNELPF